jgi:hypothetical protein
LNTRPHTTRNDSPPGGNSACQSRERCRFHPDRKAAAACEKYSHGYCASCLESDLQCTDETLYCRHRSRCIIWELTLEGKERD